jgi:hypothetical protein
MNPEELLATYLEHHPEDLEKWQEFLLPKKDTTKPVPISRNQIQNLVNVILEHMPEQDESSDSDHEVPQNEMVNLATIEVPQTGVDKALPLDWITRDGDTNRVDNPDPALCNLCRQPYKESQATTTLLCGHKYHSQCWFLYEEHSSWCNVRQCHKSSIHIMSDVFEKKNKVKGDVTKSLLRALKKKKEFQTDLKNLKTYCRDVTRANNLIDCAIKGERADIIEKYSDTLNAIQKDMNDASVKVMKSEETAMYRKAIRLAKKEVNNIFRKYHLDLRDLINNNLLKISWAVRYTVQHHRNYFSTYKMGIRLYPGRKLFGISKSRLQRNIEFLSDSEEEEV